MTIGVNTWQSLLTEHLQKSIRPLIVILGPTASGKTAFSVEMAKWVRKHPPPSTDRPFDCRSHSASSEPSAGRSAWPIGIINADSRQLYRYMDIGTAKITEVEKKGIPHHLFSVLDPKEKVTVGWYKKTAEKVINNVLARGAIPILVGGSMLYISAVTDGYVFTGRGGKRVAPTPYDLLIFGMQWTRGELVKRIEERTKKLIGVCHTERSRSATHGLSIDYARDDTLLPTTWLQEVAWLLSHGYTIQDPGMESHGYRDIAEWILQGEKEEEFPSLIEHINATTRQYAKRQITWWRHEHRIHWVDISNHGCAT